MNTARGANEVPEAVRRRFTAHSAVVYRGSTETRLSPVGRLFAWCLALIGAPLPPFAGTAEAAVEVSPVPGGISWARRYRGPFGIDFAVRSIKRLAEDGRLLECCGGGWRVRAVEDGNRTRERRRGVSGSRRIATTPRRSVPQPCARGHRHIDRALVLGAAR